MIDRYGQYMHKDWPGKIRDDSDFSRRVEEEAANFTVQPGLKQ